MRLRSGLIVVAVLWALATRAIPARADLALSATGGTVAAGSGTLTIPVYVTSDASDSLGQFTVVFNIQPDASNALPPVASLEFVSPDSYLTDPTLTASNYIFGPNDPADQADANSFKFSSGDTFGQASPNAAGYDVHFAGSDDYNGSNASGGADMVTGVSYLLANLVVQFTAPITTNPSGDVFDITLDTAASSFADGFGNPLTLASPTGSDPTLATVTVEDITSSSAVPEPSSLSLVLAGVAAVVVWRLRSRRG